jgi:acyl-CoA dehydrogenase
MGIRGNATCELVLDDVQGWLVGEANHGLQAMFVMMNAARVGVGVQAVGVTDYAYQCSRAYASERTQLRAPAGPVQPDQPADPIIVHPDVRRMLLTQKAYAEGGRALAYWTALLLDEEAEHPQADQRDKSGRLAAFLTPVVKAFLTDNAFEGANHAVQVHGGHGYIQETGIEQYVRDVRITQIYEGTNGIQALDLLGRKVLGDRAQSLGLLLSVVRAFALDSKSVAGMSSFCDRLSSLADAVQQATSKLDTVAALDANEVGGAAHHYLRVLGHLTFAFLWARMANVALAALQDSLDDAVFYKSKLATAHFYFDRLMPEVQLHFAAMASGSATLMVPVELLN